MKFFIKKPTLNDIEDIFLILMPYSNEGIILERTRHDIKKNLKNFLVAKIKDDIVGVISYFNYDITPTMSSFILATKKKDDIVGVISYFNYDKTLNEIRSLAVKQAYSNNGIGTALLKSLIKSLLKDYQFGTIFVLTYYPQFFKKVGCCFI